MDNTSASSSVLVYISAYSPPSPVLSAPNHGSNKSMAIFHENLG